jgi:hypothetical protein
MADEEGEVRDKVLDECERIGKMLRALLSSLGSREGDET